MAIKSKAAQRARRHARVRKYRFGTAARPRLCVTRSTRHMFVQVIDDVKGVTLASASTMEAELRAADLDKTAKAKRVGELVAERAKAAGVEAVVFDRGGNKLPRPCCSRCRRCTRGRSCTLMSEQNVKETQVSEAVVAETAETSNQREERRNNRGERRGRGERRNNRAREEEKDKYIERVVTINRVSRSSRVVVASASPRWSSLVTVTAWSALATVRLRKFRSNLQGCRGSKEELLPRSPHRRPHHPAPRAG